MAHTPTDGGPAEQFKFKLGDVVTWTSQAQGHRRVKAGEVVEVVTPGQRPSRELFPSLYRHSGCGYGRDHESYVVMVRRTPMWPRVAHLSLGNGLARAAVAAAKTERTK